MPRQNLSPSILCFLWLLAVLLVNASVQPVRAALPDADFVRLCDKGTAAEVEQALKNGANANARDADGLTALGTAAMREDGDKEGLRVVQALLAAGAEVNGTDESDETALVKAVENRSDIAVIRALLAAGAQAEARNHYEATALSVAVGYAGSAPVVQALAAAGANVHAVGKHDSCTYLIRAAQRHHDAAVFRALLEAGVEVNAACTDGTTVLMTAADFGSHELVTLLLEAGADRNLKDREGHDALWHAQESDREGVRIREWERRGAESSQAAAEGSRIIRLLQAENPMRR